FTFNQVRQTEEWRRSLLDRLPAPHSRLPLRDPSGRSINRSAGCGGGDRSAGLLYSIGWWAMAGGSRPASSQPATAAISGMPIRMNSRFTVGTVDSEERPSSELSQEKA